MDSSGRSTCTHTLSVGADVSQLRWDPSDSSSLATLSGDKTLRRWDLRSKAATGSASLSCEYINMAWSPCGAHVAVSSALGDKGGPHKDSVTLVDAKTFAVVAKRPFECEVNECVWADSSHLLLTTEHGTVEVHRYDPASGALEKKAAVVAHTGDCFSIAVHPGTRKLAVGSKDSLVSVWALDDLVCEEVIPTHATPVRSVSFSANGKFVASSAYDTSVAVHRADKGCKLMAAIDTGSISTICAFHPTKPLVAWAVESKSMDRTGFVKIADLSKVLR